MGSSEGQTYCLRWNNHKSNLVEILDALIKMESYVDCTIAVDEQIKFKAHRVILAANSPYFQSILQDYGSTDHCYLLFPGVQAFEMRALLEYMYTGEVNVTQSQIPKIMKIAEQLEVKGLFDMHDLKEKFNKFEENPLIQNHPFNGPPPFQHKENELRQRENGNKHRQLEQQQSSPIITTSTTNVTAAQSSSSSPPSFMYKSPYSSLYNRSPGPSTSERQKEHLPRDQFREREHREPREFHRERTDRDRDQQRERDQQKEREQFREQDLLREHEHRERGHQQQQQQQQQQFEKQQQQQQQQQQHQQHSQQWPISPILPHSSMPSTAAASMLSSVYESAPDMNPLKRKKISSISSMLMSQDTPILRNVLAQSHVPDSSQPMPLIVPQQPQPERTSSIKLERSNSDKSSSSVNCSGLDFSTEKKYKFEEPHSPFTDKSFEDDNELPPNFSTEFRSGSQSNSQKPEWKRYKQYTRNDILAAIDCVRNGMSALQASRKFGVPSRTLYDKVKKLGITTNRPMNRTVKRSPSTGGSGSAAFPFSYGQVEMLAQYNEDKERSEREIPQHLPTNLHQHQAAAALLDSAFLQQALESRGGDIAAGREALHAMALAAAAHAAMSSSSPTINGAISTSPGTNGTVRSPSPGFSMKYSSHRSSPPLQREVLIKRELIERIERDRELEREHQFQHLEREHEIDRNQNLESESDLVRERQLERDHEPERDCDPGINKKALERSYSSASIVHDHHRDEEVEDLSVAKHQSHNIMQPLSQSPIFNAPSGVIVSTKLPSTSDDFTSKPIEAKRELLSDEPPNRD